MNQLYISFVVLLFGFLAGGFLGQLPVSAREPAASCADMDGVPGVTIDDAVYLLNYLFLGGPQPVCGGDPSCANLNGDATVDVSDSVYLLNWLFLGGPAPVCEETPQKIEGFTALGENEQGQSEYRHDQTGIIFVLIPGTGEEGFQMGSPDAECQRDDDEEPVHTVRLSPYLIAKYEVSQAQWRAVMGNNPSSSQGNNLPVETISWERIQEFEARTGLELPTEAQWEYACRAGTTTAFGLGDGDCISTDQVNYDGNGPYCPPRCPKGVFRSGTWPVDSGKPNRFGLFNMHGNVWEWCEDIYDSESYERAEASGLDPLATSGRDRRVVRGGSFARVAWICRSAKRNWFRPWVRNFELGFRPSRPLP